MTQAALLEQIRDANRSFVSGTPRFLAPDGKPFIVLACIDPRLTGLLEPALGLPRHRALVVRTAGNQFSDSCKDSLRSVVAGIFLKGGSELLVVGHTDCALSRFSANDAIESFRKAGVLRTAFGNEDLRTWFGAFHDIKANVLETISALRKSGVFPAGFKIHGLVLDSESGSLDVVLDGDVSTGEAGVASTAASTEVRAPSILIEPEPEKPSSPPRLPKPPPLPREKRISGPVVIEKTGSREEPKPSGKPPTSMLDAAMILREFVMRERKGQKFQTTMSELSMTLKRERDPSAILDRLEDVVNQYKAHYPQLPAALEIFKRSLEVKGPKSVNVSDWIRRILD